MTDSTADPTIERLAVNDTAFERESPGSPKLWLTGVAMAEAGPDFDALAEWSGRCGDNNRLADEDGLLGWQGARSLLGRPWIRALGHVEFDRIRVQHTVCRDP